MAAVVLAGCGSPETEAGGPATAAPSPSSSPAFLYSCVNTPFDPARLEGPGNLENDDSELGQALRDLMETDEFLRRAEEWRVVVEEGDRVEAVGLAPSKFGYMHAIFERSADSWKPAGWGDCEPGVVIGSRSPATWELAEEPSPDDTQVTVLATERSCSSGRKLTQDITRSDVTYTEDAVSIVVSADSRVGGTCVDNPPSRLVVDLDQPIGDRILLDAAVYPPERRYP